MFVGEEILHSARVWTHGYDIFAPDENLVSALTALAASWCWLLQDSSPPCTTSLNSCHPPQAPMNTGAPLPTGQAYLFEHGAWTAHCCWVPPVPVCLFMGATCCTAGRAMLDLHRCHLLHSWTSHAGLSLVQLPCRCGTTTAAARIQMVGMLDTADPHSGTLRHK